MGSKKKRKSANPAEEHPTKRPSSQQGRRPGGGSGSEGPLSWTAEGVAVNLSPGQALLFAGRATLEVQSGEIAAAGAIITAASGAVKVCADERCGGSLVLEPGAALGTVPLAASGTAAFTLTRLPCGGGGTAAQPSAPDADPSAQLLGDEEAAGKGAGGARRRGFQAWLADDPRALLAAPTPLPALWQQAVGEVEASLAEQAQQGGGPGVIVVCGPKKVGKSTFGRVLVNALLAQHPCVAYLDTDCGQPEFTAPGLLSLTLVRRPVLGPPHMHLRRPAAAFFLGDTSPACDPVLYLQYIQELYSWYCRNAAAAAATGGQRPQQEAQQQQREAPLPPLVVNTHGWVKGMGFDVLVELLRGLPVSHLVQIAAANPKKNLPPDGFWLGGDVAATAPQPAIWLLPGLGGDQPAPQPTLSDTSARSAAATQGPAASEGGGGGGGGGRGRLHAVEQRALQWEALAQQCVERCGVAPPPASHQKAAAAGAAAVYGPQGELGDQLAAAVPYEVDAAQLEVQVLHSSVPPSRLYYALNGAVVGLCCSPPSQPLGTAPQAQPPALPCLGLGIVRAADAAARRLFILTAVREAELESVSVLQLGRLELPASLLQTAAHLSPYLCLHSLSSMGTGAGAIKSRNNLLRQGQL